MLELQPLVENAELLRQPWQDVSNPHGSWRVAGVAADWPLAIDALNKHRIDAEAYYDLKPAVWRRRFAGKPVYPGALAAGHPELQILFAGKAHKKWFGASPPGIQRCAWLQPLEEWKQVGRHRPELLRDFGDRLSAVLAMLEDQESRLTLASIVRARLDGNSGYHRIAPYAEYDHPLVKPEIADIVIDAGAFDGDTAREFSRAVTARGKVISLEPSQKNFERLRKMAGQRRFSNVVPLMRGVWSEPCKLRFDGERGSSSKIAAGEGTEIDVTSIDALVGELDLPRVDLIKLDVEGAESQAIVGATKTIREHRPKLQVSIYHQRDDLFELPEQLSELTPEYRYYLGHHSHYHMETDLYAVPVERARLAR